MKAKCLPFCHKYHILEACSKHQAQLNVEAKQGDWPPCQSTVPTNQLVKKVCLTCGHKVDTLTPYENKWRIHLAEELENKQQAERLFKEVHYERSTHGASIRNQR